MGRCGNKTTCSPVPVEMRLAVGGKSEAWPGSLSADHEISQQPLLYCIVHIKFTTLKLCSQATRFGFHVTKLMVVGVGTRGTRDDARG